MKILNYKVYKKNTLQGFLEIETPQGYIFKNLTHHKKVEGAKTSEWLGLPAREYTKDDGSKGYANVVDFATKNLYWDFVEVVLAALKEHLAQGQMQEPTGTDDESPF